MVRRVKKRKFVKTAIKTICTASALVGILATPPMVDYLTHGRISRFVGKNLIFVYSRNGQYWQGIREHERFNAALNDVEYIENPQPRSKETFPDPEILDKWPVMKSNEISVLSSDHQPVQLVKKVPTRIHKECKDIPEVVKRALTLREDREFYKHGGINWPGKLRAILHLGRIGGSGITEQTAKMIFTERGKPPSRSGFIGLAQKLKEILYAAKLDAKKGKDKVLCFYANNVYFGDGNYGIEAAAKDYFKKPAEKLTLSEALFLAVLIKNPGTNAKNGGFDFHYKRYKLLVDSLYEDELLTKAEYENCKKKNALRIKGGRKELISKIVFPSSLDALLDEFSRRYEINLDEILRSADPSFGFNIITTVRKEEIQRLQAAVNYGLIHQTAEVGAVVLDESRRILAVIGRRNNATIGNLNLAVNPEMKNKPLASNIKPFFYAVAYQEGLYESDDFLNDDPTGLKEPPKNWDERYDREMTLERALATSNNVIARKVYDEILMRLGYNKFLRYLEKLGVDTFQYKDKAGDSSIALGSKGGVTSIGLAAVYLALHDGDYIEPTIIETIKIGSDSFLLKRERTNVFWRDTILKVRRSLRRTAGILGGMPKGVYLKTGTSTDYKHTRIAGFYDNGESTKGFAVIVMNENGSSLGEGAYASRIVSPLVSLYLRQEAAQTVYRTHPGTVAVIQPEELQGPEVVIERLPETTSQTQTGNLTLADCEEHDIKGLMEISSLTEIRTLHDIREIVQSCNLKYDTSSYKWALFRFSEGLVADRLNELIVGRQEGNQAREWYKKQAIAAYQNVIDNPISEEIKDLAQDRLDKLIDRTGF